MFCEWAVQTEWTIRAEWAVREEWAVRAVSAVSTVSTVFTSFTGASSGRLSSIFVLKCFPVAAAHSPIFEEEWNFLAKINI